MKLFRFALVLFLLLQTTTVQALSENPPQEVVSLANNALVLYGRDPLIVAVVKGQNAEKKTLDEIKELDQKWKSASGIEDYMLPYMESACADYLKRTKKSKSYFAEIFLMDRLGANVAMTTKTSDYWQGDEEKFIESYNNGEGAVYYSEIEFDQSTQAQLIHVSIPVMDGDKAIGAMTFGIEIEKIK